MGNFKGFELVPKVGSEEWWLCFGAGSCDTAWVWASHLWVCPSHYSLLGRWELWCWFLDISELPSVAFPESQTDIFFAKGGAWGSRKKMQGLWSAKPWSLKKASKFLLLFTVCAKSESQDFDQRGWITFKSNRLGKYGFRVLTVYAVVEKVSLIQIVCTKNHCQSLPSFSSTLRLWVHSDHWHKMCVWWKGEGGISLFPLLLCFVMFCVCSVCLQDQRSDSES